MNIEIHASLRKKKNLKHLMKKKKKILVTKAVIKDIADFEQLPISVFRSPFFFVQRKKDPATV